jgi:hypothetical protein
MQSFRFSWHFISKIFAVIAILVSAQPLVSRAAARSADSTETIVMIRHGEKPPGGLGQLSCKGLNRALALPDVLIQRYGKPDYIYVPNPSVRIHDHLESYSYVRPLATVEPTAIRAGLPVNAQIGYDQIDQLRKALTQPEYAHAHILVAWEHVYLHDFAQHLLEFYGEDSSVVPPWPGSDYDTIYVFQLSEQNGKRHLSFSVEHEGLDGSLSDACPMAGSH